MASIASHCRLQLTGAFRRNASRRPCHRPLSSAVESSPHRELIVVRHGETDWNRDLRVQGSTDVPLNARGLAQARLCADRLAGELGGVGGPGRTPRVCSSELSRAVDTAEAIALALGSPSSSRVGVSEFAQLNEWDLGVIEGMEKNQAAEEYPDDWAIFSQWMNPRVSRLDAARRICGGESMEEVRTRAVGIMERFCEESRQAAGGSPVIMVTHGGVLGQLLRHVCQQGCTSDEQVEEWSGRLPSNGSISRFAVTRGGWEIMNWAETNHLRGDAAPASANYNREYKAA